MRSLAIAFVGMLCLALATDVVMAQRGGGRGQGQGQGQGQKGMQDGRGGGPQGGPQGGPGERGPRHPHSPLIAALDADKDGKLSADEIKNAAAALLTLDENGDGELTLDEIRPAGAPGRRGPGMGQGGPGQGQRPGDGTPSAEQFIQRIMSMDKNGDGKVSKNEMPTQARRMLRTADTNKDGALDEAELKAMSQRFQGGRGQGGPGAGRDGRGQSGRGGGQGGRGSGGGR